ncbi:MAG: pyridoxamine 5'-phosphate oxidase family protein [Dehalococcoidales bacterium]|nr:pyridoxamine 5'-phosphate oxidase family protein [Dehalococcoidales bacterium]
MRRKDKEITDIDDIEEIIKKAICCRIGLVDNDEPYIVPVSFGYERNALYFHGASEGRKIELIKKNNKVCFEIDTDVAVVKAEKPCQWTMRYRSVIGVGKARILENAEEKARALRLIMGHYAEGDFSFPKSELDSVLVVRIDIENITGKKSGY